MTTTTSVPVSWRDHNPGPINASILQALEEFDAEGGLTCEEIENLLGLEHQTVSAQISHLKNGTLRHPILIEPTGLKVKTSRGRRAAKLRLKRIGVH